MDDEAKTGLKMVRAGWTVEAVPGTITLMPDEEDDDGYVKIKSGLMDIVLSADDADWLAKAISKTLDAAYSERERRQPYYKKALRLTVRTDITVGELRRWRRQARKDISANSAHYAIGDTLSTLVETHENTTTWAPSIEILMGWLAGYDSHPFDVFICDAADMPEWDPDAADE
jgi:hypothetical protein